MRIATTGLLAAMAGWTTSAGAQEPCPVDDVARAAHEIDVLLQRGIQDGIAPAMAAAVVHNGVVCLTVAVGRETWRPSRRPVLADSTRFDLASLTKVLGPVALAAVSVEQGRIAWGRPVTVLARERGKSVSSMTFAQLLAHNAGLPAGPEWPRHLVRRGRRAVRRVAIPTRTSSRWRSILATGVVAAVGRPIYSDIGANLLWVALGRVWHDEPAALAARLIWLPLNMQSVSYDPQAGPVQWGLASRTSDGRVHDPLARLLRTPAGHAGIFATVADVARLVADLTRPTPVVFSSATQAAMLGALSADGAFGLVPCAWQHGCGTHFTVGARGHTGYTGTSLWIDQGVGIVLLTNRALAPRMVRADDSTRVDRFHALYALRTAVADVAIRAFASR